MHDGARHLVGTHHWIEMVMEPTARQSFVCQTLYSAPDIGIYSGTAAGRTIGVARAASIIAVKVLGDDGYVIIGLTFWIRNPQSRLSIVVVLFPICEDFRLNDMCL